MRHASFYDLSMNVPIKRAPTLFLKTVILVISLCVLVLCAFLFPMLPEIRLKELPEFRYIFLPFVIGIYASAVPFFLALYQAFRLLQHIDHNDAFSEKSVTSLRDIKFCAIAMSVCYAAAFPMIAVFAELDDAPGAILMAAAVVVAPLIVATFAAVLQKLVRSAIDMKAENDFTV